MNRNETEEIVLDIITQTNDAYFLHTGGEEDEPQWIPKSLCKKIDGNKDNGTFRMPVWLAEEKEFI